jgi:ankyrin repeat protein
MNSWNVTPITIAMLNNHLGTVKRLLKEKVVDVNGKDDKGRTLLSMAMLNLEDSTCVEFAKFLISKGADVNLGDVEFVTPLHILAGYVPEPDSDKEGKARIT